MNNLLTKCRKLIRAQIKLANAELEKHIDGETVKETSCVMCNRLLGRIEALDLALECTKAKPQLQKFEI